VAEAWAAEELSLPMHAQLRDDEIEWVARGVQGAMSALPLRSSS
jgi:dTDP-4-amino-4,6-dideoxygalactose transaminase